MKENYTVLGKVISKEDLRYVTLLEGGKIKTQTHANKICTRRMHCLLIDNVDV